MTSSSVEEFSGPPDVSLDVLSQTEQCVVCGDAADGFHYGVRSCRGCNAFFRRVVTYGSSFKCRKGGKCPVVKNLRCGCRACRFAKCVAVGMDSKAVQPKREPGRSSSTGASELECERGAVRVPKLEVDGSPSGFSPQASNVVSDLFMPALVPSPPPDCSLIGRMCYDYQDQKRRRWAMLCNTLAEILCEESEHSLRSTAQPEDFSALFQVQMVLMFEWAEKLHEFRTLVDPLDKTRLLRAFALRYLVLDNVFHTVELGLCDRIVLVNNNYMVPGQYPPIATGENPDMTRVKLSMFGGETQEMLDDLVLPMTQMALTAGEMMTLRMIMFWNPGNVGLSQHGLSIAQEASNVAVKELHVYLEHEGIGDMEQRIGNILLLLPSFTKHVQYLYDMVKLIPCFGQMNESDRFIDDLLKGF